MFDYFYDRFIPQNIDITIGNECNLKCRMCLFHGENGISSEIKKLNFIDFKNIVDSIKDYNGNINLYTEGEPLVNSDFFMMLDYLNYNNIKTNDIYTNGMLLNSVNQNLLLNLNNLKMVVISIDGLKESSETQRLGSDWDLTVKNLKEFIELRDKKNKNLEIMVKFTRSETHSKEEIDEFVDYFLKLGLDNLFILSKLEWLEGGGNFWRDDLINGDLFPDNKPENFLCPYLKNYIRLDTFENKIILCGMNGVLDKKIDFYNFSIIDFYNSSLYNDLRRKQFYNEKGVSCYNCMYKNLYFSKTKISYIEVNGFKYQKIIRFPSTTYKRVNL